MIWTRLNINKFWIFDKINNNDQSPESEDQMVVNFVRQALLDKRTIQDLKLQVKVQGEVRVFNLNGLTQVLNFMLNDLAAVGELSRKMLPVLSFDNLGVHLVALSNDDVTDVNVKIEEVRTFPLSEYDDGLILGLKDDSAIDYMVEFLREVRQISKVDLSRVAVSLPAQWVFVKVIEYRECEDHLFQEYIEDQLPSLFSVAPEMLLCAWRKMEVVAGKARILILGVLRDIYASYLEVFEKAGIEPVVITGPVEAYPMLLKETSFLREDGCISAVLDVRKNTALFNVFYNDHLMYNHDIVRGDSQERFVVEVCRVIDFYHALSLERISNFLVTGSVDDLEEFQSAFDKRDGKDFVQWQLLDLFNTAGTRIYQMNDELREALKTGKGKFAVPLGLAFMNV